MQVIPPLTDWGFSGLGAPSDPMCDTGRQAAAMDPGSVLYQTYFGTDARRKAFIAQCGPISLSPVIPPPTQAPPTSPAQILNPPPPTTGGVVETPPLTTCPTGYVLLAGQCQQLGGDLGPPVIPTPTPVTVPIGSVTPGPNCVGANYTVDAHGNCVYPAGGPSGGYSPPLVVTAPPGQTPWISTPATCPDGSQPLLDGSCPVNITPAPPSTLSVIEGYLTNPWVLIGGGVLIYLATRKTRRSRRV